MQNPYQFIDFKLLDNSQILKIFEWRNNSKIRKWMDNKELILLEDHLAFFKKLHISNNLFFLVKRFDKEIGVYSLKKNFNNEAEVGFYISPDEITSNISLEFLFFSINFVFDNLKLKRIYGFVYPENKSVNKLNKLLGFKESKKTSAKYIINELKSDFWKKEIFNCTKINKLINYSLKNIKL